MDWSDLQIGGAMLLRSRWRESVNERDLKQEQAVQFLNGPDFIPAESQPARLDFIPDASGGRFRFPTQHHHECLTKKSFQTTAGVAANHRLSWGSVSCDSSG